MYIRVISSERCGNINFVSLCIMLFQLGQNELQPVADLQGHTVVVEEGHLLNYLIIAMLLSAASSFDQEAELMLFSSPIDILMAGIIPLAIMEGLEEVLIALR